nr:hypothetical transcript [Hymenolepis microstoma]
MTRFYDIMIKFTVCLTIFLALVSDIRACRKSDSDTDEDRTAGKVDDIIDRIFDSIEAAGDGITSIDEKAENLKNRIFATLADALLALSSEPHQKARE